MVFYKKLKPGKEVEIYLESDSSKDGFVYEGPAVLIEPAGSWMEQVPFPIKTFPKQINVIKEKWLVHLKGDKFSKGIRCTRWVYKYHSEGTITIQDSHPYSEFISGFCIDILDDEYKCMALKSDLRNGFETPIVKRFYEYVENLDS